MIVYIASMSQGLEKQHYTGYYLSRETCICPNCRFGTPERDKTRKNCAPFSHIRDMFCILLASYIHSGRLTSGALKEPHGLGG